MHVDLNDPVSRRGLGLVFLVGTLLMVGLGVQDLVHVLDMTRWQAVPCDVVRSDVSIDPAMRVERPYRFQVNYRYDWAGRRLLGQVYRRKYSGNEELSQADRLVQTYPAGARRVCYVNPHDPGQAALVRDPLEDPIGIIAIAVVFILPMSIYLLLPPRQRRTRTGRLAQADRPFLMFGCVLLSVAGCGIFGMFAAAMYHDLAARRWTETSCQILHSQVRSHVMSSHEVHFTVYWPDVAYSYQVGGRPYRSSRFNFTERSSPWFYGKRAIVTRYRPGLRTICYVNPADPTEATLTRGWRVSVWFGFWPLVMGIAGVWCLLGMLGVAGPDLVAGDPLPQKMRWLGPAAVAMLAGFTTQLFFVLSSDLANDWQAGRAEVAEAVWVALAGLAMAGSMAVFIALIRMRRPRRVLAEATETS